MNKVCELFRQELRVVNFGVESFYLDLKGQGVPAVQTSWKPVAGGDPRLAALLEKLR